MSGRLWLLALGLVVLFVAAVASMFAFLPMSRNVTLEPLVGDIKRGAYLARLGGCVSCHTKEGGAPFAGGVELASPFGKFISPNITPDRQSGIGDWTVEQFAVAMRKGVSPEGAPYYPAFPYQFYAGMTDQDIVDLWAAFKVVPPIDAAPGEHEIGFPFNIRAGLKFWRVGFEDRHDFTPDPAQSESWNRGLYLVEGVGHCGVCHTPRNVAGGRLIDRRLEGNPRMFGGGDAPALVSEALRDAGWTSEALVAALRSGSMPNGDVFGGAMAEYVRDNSSFFLSEDLNDIATYLLDE